MKTASWTLSFSMLAGCTDGPGGLARSGGAEARVCGLEPAVEALVVADATGLLQDAEAMGAVPDAGAATLSYQATLFGSLSGTGEVDLGRCARGEDPGQDSCTQMGDGAWSCARLVCENAQSARVEAWFSPEQGSSISLDRGGGQVLTLAGEPTYTWTLSADDAYSSATVAHTVSALLTDAGGQTYDLSYTVQGSLDRGATAAALEIAWPGLERGRAWTTRLNLAGDQVDGALLRDGEQVATLEEARPRSLASLELSWEGCDGAPPTDAEVEDCGRRGRSGCAPVHS